MEGDNGHGDDGWYHDDMLPPDQEQRLVGELDSESRRRFRAEREASHEEGLLDPAELEAELNREDHEEEDGPSHDNDPSFRR